MRQVELGQMTGVTTDVGTLGMGKALEAIPQTRALPRALQQAKGGMRWEKLQKPRPLLVLEQDYDYLTDRSEWIFANGSSGTDLRESCLLAHSHRRYSGTRQATRERDALCVASLESCLRIPSGIPGAASAAAYSMTCTVRSGEALQ